MDGESTSELIQWLTSLVLIANTVTLATCGYPRVPGKDMTIYSHVYFKINWL